MQNTVLVRCCITCFPPSVAGSLSLPLFHCASAAFQTRHFTVTFTGPLLHRDQYLTLQFEHLTGLDQKSVLYGIMLLEKPYEGQTELFRLVFRHVVSFFS